VTETPLLDAQYEVAAVGVGECGDDSAATRPTAPSTEARSPPCASVSASLCPRRRCTNCSRTL